MDTEEGNSFEGEEETYLREGEGMERNRGKRNITINMSTNNEEDVMTFRGWKRGKFIDSKEDK